MFRRRIRSLIQTEPSNIYICKIYKKMINKYSKYKDGATTKFGVTVSPKFMKALHKRYSELSLNN